MLERKEKRFQLQTHSTFTNVQCWRKLSKMTSITKYQNHRYQLNTRKPIACVACLFIAEKFDLRLWLHQLSACTDISFGFSSPLSCTWRSVRVSGFFPYTCAMSSCTLSLWTDPEWGEKTNTNAIHYPIRLQNITHLLRVIHKTV